MSQHPPDLPDALRDKVLAIGASVSPDEIEVYGRYQEIADRSAKLRTILAAWERQHTEERQMRQRYARWLLVGMFIQMALVNFAFFAIGWGWIQVSQWVATSFILAVFGEISGMVFFIVKYLFPKVSSDVLATVEKL
jgi:hypothetical protein